MGFPALPIYTVFLVMLNILIRTIRYWITHKKRSYDDVEADSVALNNTGNEINERHLR